MTILRRILIKGGILAGMFTVLNGSLCGLAAGSSITQQEMGITTIGYDGDGRQWGGMTNGLTHQVSPQYQAKKVLDLSSVEETLWRKVRQARLSVYTFVQDYSWHDGTKNGLDEDFEVVINGHVHRYPTSCGIPAMELGKPAPIGWYDFIIPLEELVRDKNEIVFRKAKGTKDPKYDDYLYIGIDNTVNDGTSFVSFDGGKSWRRDVLNTVKATGEYMVRLILISKDTTARVIWSPGIGKKLDDPSGLIGYCGSPSGKVQPFGLLLDGNDEARMEWEPRRIDPFAPVVAIIKTSSNSPFVFRWLDRDGMPQPTVVANGPVFEAQLPGNRRSNPSGFAIEAIGADLLIESITVQTNLNYQPVPELIDMAPKISPPMGEAADRVPFCHIAGDKITLGNTHLSASFQVDGRLSFVSLHNQYAACEMLRAVDATPLFVIEIDGRRYRGADDFDCRSVTPLEGKEGFIADLFLKEYSLKAEFTAWVDSAALRWGLSFTNEGEHPLDFKAAFPVIAGLSIGDDPLTDYYFFPWGGGIIADTPAIIRRGYGDYGAIYQVMDLFSPQKGAGLLVRVDDVDGRYKVMSLRKWIPGREEFNADRATTPTKAEYKWANTPLERVPGTGFAYEYLRRTRAPGETFSPAEAVIEAHPGDWHVAMERYSAWAHQVWKFRPYPSRLDKVINMVAVGWGQSPIFMNGEYRRDFLRPRVDCLELMSWWEWSPLGPWRTPWDQLEQKIGKTNFERYKPYWVVDPVTKKLYYPLNRGDYDGYNERWGGLPALQEAVKDYQKAGKLVTLYTDPILACDNTKLGQNYGRLWGVVDSSGDYVTNYLSWNMCHDVAEYREYVASTIKRVLRETGVDGIRLDEYGHQGWACFNPLHKHTFAEPGCTEWQRAIAEATRLVREAMDEVDPSSLLTTEHPGYDFLMQFIDGCITYDLTVQAMELRPLECNIQRFYFPECKAYELDHRGQDTSFRKRFWNAVAAFGEYPAIMYSVLKENSDVFGSRDCRPLIPTLARRIYANQFNTEEKTIYTLYNASGYTFEGEILELPLSEHEHLFDLLRCRSCEVESQDGVVRVSVYLPKDGVTAIARLPRIMHLSCQEDTCEITVDSPGEGWRLVLYSAEGEALLEKSAREGFALNLSALRYMAKDSLCVKLLDSKQLLLDALEVPLGSASEN